LKLTINTALVNFPKMTTIRRYYLGSFFLLLAACEPNTQKDYTADYIEEDPDPIYAEHVRSSSFQSPEDEMADFELPPGFEVTLFASEPDITKPINMAFDDKGRLWVTQSSEYPIKAGPGEGQDRISILEDTDGDGKADKITHFAEDLNIPIGIIPVKDGAIGYSIPHVYRFYDKDEDGTADQREVLIADFEHKDTHGMVNNLFRGLDGWIHASHGFSNVSVVAGKDGDSIKMTSGNTFRLRPDGSRVEKTTDGRINPFGSDLDKWGYHYSADCHTLPIYQLIWGGNYTQWGKKEPNLGFAPSMMDYGLNSTALSGLVYYTDDQFPEEFRNSFYSGDVVTCRISRSVMDFHGSTPKARRKVDFLVSKDPWFRPVDIKIGPDGAMYIADFYNKIIGHYEVPLDHPERDRSSGRIWKITYKGNERQAIEWPKASIDDILESMGSPILQTRMAATDALVDYHGNRAGERLRKTLGESSISEEQYIQVLWALLRIQELTDPYLEQSLSHPSPLIRVHALRVLANFENLSEKHNRWAIEAMADKNPHVQRAAAEFLVHHPHPDAFPALVTLYQKTPKEDTHLRYTAKLALYHQMLEEHILKLAVDHPWKEGEISLISMALADVNHPMSAEFLFDQFKFNAIPKDRSLAYLSSVSRNIPRQELQEVILFAKGNAKADHSWVSALEEGVQQRGGEMPKSLFDWGLEISNNVLSAPPSRDLEWNDSIKAKYQFALQKSKQAPSEKHITTYKAILSKPDADEDTKALAAGNLILLQEPSNAAYLVNLIHNPDLSLSQKQKIIQSIGSPTHTASRKVLVEGLAGTPLSLQETIANRLVQTSEGVSILLDNINQGIVPARVLKARNVEENFQSNASSPQKKEYERLTSNLLPINEEKQILIKTRTSEFDPVKEGLTLGAQLYEKNCSMCHQIENKGGMIGPQLDGIGNWGLDALAVKVLDPNRNISENFRMYNISMKDGKKVSGLYRREEGNQLVLADQSGNEFKLNITEIESQTPVKSTLMPDNFGEVLGQEDFNRLMTYLLNVR
jgi:putative heme-binding domain-containing protein